MFTITAINYVDFLSNFLYSFVNLVMCGIIFPFGGAEAAFRHKTGGKTKIQFAELVGPCCDARRGGEIIKDKPGSPVQ